MNKKLLKILSGVVILGLIGTYGNKLWENYTFKKGLDLNAIELKQSPLDIVPIKLSGSMHDIWSVKNASNIVSLDIMFLNEGEKFFKKQHEGLETMVNTLLEGTKKYDKIGIKKVLMDNSISLNLASDKDDIVLHVTFLKKHFKLVMDLIASVLTEANLDRVDLETTKQALITNKKQLAFSPHDVANLKLNNLVFPKNHPYHSSSLEASIANLNNTTKERVDSIYKKVFNPKNMRVSIISSLGESEIRKAFNTLVDILRKSGKEVIKNAKDSSQRSESNDGQCLSSFKQSGESTHVELNNSQSTVLFALPGVSKKSPEHYAITFANTVLGTFGLVSRLAKSVRDQKGLVYTIYTEYFDYDLASFIRGTAKTRPENVQEVIQNIRSEIKAFGERGISEEELRTFKVRYFTGNLFDSNDSILNFVTHLRRLNVGIKDVNTYLDRYKNLTLDEVNRAIRKVFDPDKLLIVDCGRFVKKGA